MVGEMVSDLMMEIEEEKNSYNQNSIYELCQKRMSKENLITFKSMREHSNPGNTLRDSSDGKENKVMKE